MKRAWIWIPGLAALALFVAVGVHALRRASMRSDVTATAPSAPPAAGGVEAVRVTPAPAREGLVFVGPDGDFEDGSPRQSVDRTALLGLLYAGRSRELSEQMESLQTTFESDPRKERWIYEAMLGFRQADAALDAPIDAWVTAEPDSFAPVLARCAHLDAVGWERRGTGFAAETSRDAMEGLSDAFRRARVDCERALALRPGLVVARQRLLTMAHTQGDDVEAERQLALALESCPTCFRVRFVDLLFHAPRWGGSIAAMQASADAAIHAHPEAPHLRLLAGVAPYEQCRVERRPELALPHCDAAVASGEEPEFYYQRSRVRARLRDTAAALADLEHALELDPQDVDSLVAHVPHIAATQPERAIDETLTAARIDPLEHGVIDDVTWARERARLLALGAASRGDASGVQRALAYADALGVAASDLELRRGEVATVTALAAEITASPDAIEGYRRMDAALLTLGASGEILAMWDRYLAQHPDDGQAFLERGGTHYVRRELAEAGRDAQRACELGVAEGCQRARALGASR